MKRRGELRVRIDAGADGRAALRQRQQARLARLAAARWHCSICARQPDSFLAQRHRHRIHEMRAAGLEDLGPGALLLPQHVRAVSSSAGSSSRRMASTALTWIALGMHVVAALAHVDVIVRMHRLARAPCSRGARSPRWRSCWCWCRCRSGTRRAETARRARHARLPSPRRSIAPRHIRRQQAEPRIGARRGRLDQRQRAR